ncbi:MAG: hypothetical protein J6X55_11005, partial [Victivallales bacterium]|nr:hypothetical protein [Victivallales bacterium]
GARPGQHRGLAAQGYQSERAGICGGVSLKITEGPRINDWYMTSEDGIPHWHVLLSNSVGTELRWTISDNGEPIAHGIVPCKGDTTDFSTPALPKFWSDASPFLYTLTLSLTSHDGHEFDQAVRRWAPRVISVDSNRIYVNASPVYFCGVTEHCYFAETTNPHADREKYLHDLGVLRSAGFNFIRCHTWCPPEPFYDACDILGIFVQTELPSVYSFDEATAIIHQIRRHPCAVILCEGNEKIIDESAINRMKKLVDILHADAPGMLFNPQEAMRGIEYAFAPDQKILTEPVPHDPERMAIVREFTDVFGSLGGCFSYEHDTFPGADVVDKQHEIYGRPCLTHEAGILGGYLDFSLEKRYEGTFIGTDMFQAARENMQKHGVYQNAKKYYELNCRFISSVRKQLFENIRSCKSIAGYDYLGGIDTHWHLIGYPCGIFNEFYEEKFGETIADVRRYKGDTVILCSAGKFRNRIAGGTFNETIRMSYFARQRIDNGRLHWSLADYKGHIIADDTVDFHNVEPGTIADLAKVSAVLPDNGKAYGMILRVAAEFNGTTRDNEWKFWCFPKPSDNIPVGVRVSNSFSREDFTHVINGGALLLLDGFPGAMEKEHFRTHTSGRSLGHAGTVLYHHPVWKRFPAGDFADWQFYPMMNNSHSLVRDDDMPEFAPIIELIPSFKLVRRKSLLAEYAVGRGRIITCGLDLSANDPAAAWMKRVLLDYLADRDYVDAPEWNPDKLEKRIGIVISERTRKEIDAGGRPLD